MEPARKSGLFRDLFGGMGETLRTTFVEQPREWLLQAREKLRDLPKTNFDLGCKFSEEQKWYDALFRFRVTLYLQPNYPHARYNLGCAYFHLNKTAQARETFKQVLRETPSNHDAVFMLAAIDPSAIPAAQRPQEMPRATVTNFFTSVAANYNVIEAQNQYRGGIAVAEVVKPHLKVPAPEVVDLGCGSGIAVIPYRTEAKSIIGVDSTPAMVAQANVAGLPERKLYDQVIEADISRIGDAVAADSADLVLLVNVVQFIGILSPVFANAASIMKPGALLAMTTEAYANTEGFGLAAGTGRFGHSAAYVKSTASAAGLNLVSESKVALYGGAQTDLFLFSKGSR